MDREIVLKYFSKSPKFAVWLEAIAVGILLLIKMDVLNANFLLAVLIAAGIGIWQQIKFKQNQISDGEFDDFVAEDIKRLSVKALQKIGTDKAELVSEEVLITGPKLWETGGAEIHYKKGDDNYLRFTPIAVTFVNFTQNQLLTYTCVYDVVTGRALNESTDEYFYKDVVSVSTKTESRTIISTDSSIGRIQLNSAESFALTTSGGTSISVILSDPALIERMGGGEIEKSRAEKAIQSIRKVLREKKA